MKKNILLVEDDLVSAHLISRFLTELGYGLLQAVKSGEDALASISSERPDLILMDITLEGEMDGIETSHRIRERIDVPVIYLTRSSDDETIERATFTSPYGYIIKPVDKRDLYVSIEMAITRHGMERALRESETRFSTILRSIADGVIVYDREGIITYLNSKAQQMLNIYEDVTGQPIERVVSIQNNIIHDISLSGTDQSLNVVHFLVSGNGNHIPIEFRITPQMDADDNGIGTVLVLSDISGRYETELRLRESLEKLKQTMNGIIMAMVQTVETRDPYTAGHQRRVADLSRQIGHEMNLPVPVIEGLRMAAMIHDLGKISIPSEILSKPGKISEIEFNIIKTHAQKGYDILKTIEFPWPVAEIVYQHHERMDGSGYPRNLEGEQILIEARIIAVADVLEAMAFDRPYRAGVGTVVALEEIEHNRGRFFDRDVVDACIRIFREKKYRMEYLGNSPIIFL